MSADQPVRILHLSDIHFKASKKWDADPVLRELANFIKREVESGLKPDFVAITGDLAHAGIAEEYKLAKEWLENYLWPAVGNLPRDRLLLVPGNHDVDRSKVGRMVNLRQSDLLEKKNQNEITEALVDPYECDVLLKRHAAYLAFVEGWLGKPQSLPWWQRVVDIRGTKLHVAGLDSAWMACGDEDPNRLLLGRYQLTQTVETEKADGGHWRIALLHHPWDYLAEFDRHPARALVHQRCDLLLRGHLHFAQSERILPPDPSRSSLELAAGCVYENGYGYPNAFQWIELSPTNRRVRVLYRIWDKNAWSIDRNQPGCPAGDADFDLGAPKQIDLGLGHQAAPTIPPEYLEWLRRNLERMELLGAKEGRSVTLNHVYVPALTRPPLYAPALTRPPPPAEERKQSGRNQREEKEEQKPIPLLQRLNAASLYVPAPAGAGKSTFCRWAALQSIPGAELSHPVPPPAEFAEPMPADLRGRLPLLVPLREFWRSMDCGHGEREWKRADIEQALAAWVDRSPPPGLTSALLKGHLDRGSAFLLWDGLDEVPVSERRNGVTVYPRALLLSGLADALPAWQKAGNRVLLTSRPYGLDEAGLHRLGLPSAPLEPLPKALQDLFITRWFHTLGKPEKTPDLIATIGARDDVAPLVENPMLLSALCVLYDNGGRLPDDRYDLYKSIVAGVLHNRYPGDASERDPVERRLEAIAYGMHVGEAGAPRTTPAAEVSWIEVERLLAGFASANPVYEREQVNAAVRREELLNQSGLLVPRSGERASFYHLSFQEFLAAQRLARTGDALDRLFRERSATPEWRSTLLFLFAAQIAIKDAQWGLHLLQRLIADQDRTAVKAKPAPAVFIAEALELCLAKKYAVPERLTEDFRRLVLAAIEDEIELQARHALGLCLARLGDPRIFDLRDARAYVEVPAGTYPYGDKGETVEIETPFLLGKYPVTNSQYRAFMDVGGYAKRKYWSEAGWAWRQKKGVTEPQLWRDRRWNGANQPVVGVNFWEAEACCHWAGGRLPKKREWEAAARDSEGFMHPWGNYPWGGAWQDGICNSAEAGLGVTTPVGLFPRARKARLGLEDLAGNVWEWCDDVTDDWLRRQARVLCGGSFGNPSGYTRVFGRYGYQPDARAWNFGFRCVLAPPRP
ncbi:Sulphatase-modifying factor protein (modular protein) [uncultured Defluviicoccus sp.]|uniref:Sulphatase-modifying factor protein (Modular protein) n=1 Tax=metagenome TaxID=256318 RepID=A0A380THF8_9ZZZZ|nr:Sulphatase-modifying factor protein (modular protein) [uncultured Defluviicoccus sp.]